MVIDGPLLGMDGLIEKIDKRKQRVKVRLQFLGEPRLVDLCVSMVQQAE
jgi:transcriptional antiterminator NusG